MRRPSTGRVPKVGAANTNVSMDITGARWGLHGADAILELRALRSNGDFGSGHTTSPRQERQRNHESRYANGIIPGAA